MFGKRSITFKTGLGFGLILLVMAAEIFIATRGLEQSSDGFRTYRRLARNSILSGRVQANMLMASKASRDFVQTRDPLYRELYMERFEASRKFAIEQRSSLEDSRRQELSHFLVQQLDKYHQASLQLFQLVQQRDEYVQQSLVPLGNQIHEDLDRLTEASRQSADYDSATLCATTLEHLLMGRLFLFKYLESNNPADVERVRSEMDRLADLERLPDAFPDPEHRQSLRAISSAWARWQEQFEKLVTAVEERNALVIREVQPLDQSISNLSEQVKLSLKTDQDLLGPTVQQANSATGRAVLTGSLLGFSLASLIAVLFIRTINRSITALGLSEAETERLSQEIAARKKTESRLESALQEVERVNFLSDIALDLTSCGYWHVDYRDPKHYYLSPQAARILGEPWKEDGRYHLRDEWLTRVQAASPESAEHVLERYAGFLNERLDHHDATYPYRRPEDGKIIWIHALGRVVRDENGEILNLFGAYQDITRRVEAEKSLQEARDRAERDAVEMQRSLSAAAKVQQSLLPSSQPESDRVDFAWRYHPCDELAGDFLNFFALDEQHIAIYMIDVSGHGVASSLLSVTIGRMMTPQVSSTSLLVQRTEGENGIRILPPAEVASKLNRRFPMQEQNNLFFTMLYGVLNLKTGKFKYVSAGHEPLAVLPADGEPQVVESAGPAIGWFPDAEYADHEITLQPGDRFYIYSDGVPEAVDARITTFTTERMLAVIQQARKQSLDESVSQLIDSVSNWCGASGLKDDVSIIGVEWKPE